MTTPAIHVEALGKKYLISHQQRERYTALRDVLTNKAKGLGRRIIDLGRSPLTRPSSKEEFWALKDVSFEVQPGERIGIIGRNGAGKSTLLKLLSRITEPSAGRIELNGRVGSLLEVGTGFHPELTGRENIFLNGAILGMSKEEITKRFDEIVAFAEVEKFLDTPVKRYSSGMYVRLAFAVAAHLQTEILVVDEVLAVGDLAFQAKSVGKMSEVAKGGRTILFVSHNMAAIGRLCNTCIFLQEGRIVSTGATPNVVDLYYKATREDPLDQGLSVGYVLFSRGDVRLGPSEGGCEIAQIEIVNLDGNPKDVLYTWDSVIFRISYSSHIRVPRASVVLEIKGSDGENILLLSTQPDSTLQMDILPGMHSVECEIRDLPLAAGEYHIGGGLAIPNAEWLWRSEDMGRLQVSPKDVYNSGTPPIRPRSLVAVKHSWRVTE